jgi:hypothetical protein
MDQDLTLQEQAQLRNTFIEAVTNGGNCDSVLEKTASAASSFTRRRMREESFITSVIPFTKINNSDLHELIDSEEPVCLFEMEAAQWSPKVISFNDTGDTHNYIANKYYLSFYTNTTPEWTKEPIQAGKEGEVKVTFDPINRPGNFMKTIRLYGNGMKNGFLLTIRGKVLKAE